MKRLYKEEGFTLMEILVGINLSFIVITAIVSVYLLTTKFMNSFSARTEDNQMVSTALYSMDELLAKTDKFEVYPADSAVVLQMNNGAIRITKKEISVKDLYKIENIENLRFTARLAQNDQIVFDNKGLNIDFEEPLASIASAKIDSLSINFTRKNKNYSFKYSAPEEAVKRFENKSGR